MTPNLFTVNPRTLDDYDLSRRLSLEQWQHQIAKAIDQIQAILVSPSRLNSILGGLPSGGAMPPTSLTDLGSPAGNSTINTGQAFLVAINLNWTTAANWTLTLNNLALGSVVHMRLLNNSGATRTFSLAANTPTAAAYSVTLWVPGSGALTGAISVNAGNAINAHGVSFIVAGVPALQLQGFGSTG